MENLAKHADIIARHYEFLMILGIVLFFITVGSLIAWISLGSFSRVFCLSLEGIVPPFVTFPAILFSLTATLTATALWENYNVAIRAVQAESQGLATIIDLVGAIPSLKESGLTACAKQYAKSVVNDEWATLSSDRDPSPITKQYYGNLRQATYQAVDSLGNNAESKALMSAITTVSNGRMARLASVTFDVQTDRWYAIFVLGILVQLAVAIVHLTKPKALITAMTIATVAVLVPICTIALTTSGPFVGAIAISYRPFLKFMK